MKPAKTVTFGLVSIFMLTTLLRAKLEPWVYMWLLAFELYLFFKWITLVHHPLIHSKIRHPMVYLCGWVGMNPAPFKKRNQSQFKNGADLWRGGLYNLGAGLVFFYAAMELPANLWLAQGWLICASIVFTLHFGIFRLMAWGLRRRGFHVQPIMNCPVATATVAEFWGGRWNMAFNQIVIPFVYRPVKKRWGYSGALFAVFAFSGLIHELVISLPAGEGWGLPTLYFFIQAMGLRVEQFPFFKSLGALSQKTATLLIVAGPAFILFHPPFMKIVVVPFAHAIERLI